VRAPWKTCFARTANKTANYKIEDEKSSISAQNPPNFSAYQGINRDFRKFRAMLLKSADLSTRLAKAHEVSGNLQGIPVTNCDCILPESLALTFAHPPIAPGLPRACGAAVAGMDLCGRDQQYFQRRRLRTDLLTVNSGLAELLTRADSGGQESRSRDLQTTRKCGWIC
jgi:hypothetical protein